MTHHQDDNPRDERDDRLELPSKELFELLSDRALFGLEDADTDRLKELLRSNAWVRGDCMDDAVAQMAVAFNDATNATVDAEPMSSIAADRIRQAVHAEIASETSPTRELAGTISPDSTSSGTMGWLGWVAAAAAIAVAVMAWQPITPTIRNGTQLVSWVETHPDAVRWDWAPGLVNPAEGVTGYVTFSPDSQEGYMLIKGLEPNDPRIQQYQLWIWDQEREPDPENPTPLADNVHPVDGGVFDVNDQGEVVIPIKLPLRVDQPYLFAVTVERPGGVVKSEKGSVPIIAQAPAPDA